MAHLVMSVVFGTLFVILGIVFLSGRGSFLIAGYNTMSKEEKAKYDVNALCKFMGKIFLPLGILTFGFLIESIESWYIWFYLNIMFALIIFAAIYANTGNRFKK